MLGELYAGIKTVGWNINNLIYTCYNCSTGRKRRGTKWPLDVGKGEECNSRQKTQYDKNSDHSIRSHQFSQFTSVAQSCLNICNPTSHSTRSPCPSQTPEVYSNSCPSGRWCHPGISSVVPFSSCPQYHPMANRRGKWKAVTHFTFLGSKITPDCGFGHRIRKKYISWQKISVKSSYVSKSRDTTSPTNIRIVKSIVFAVFKYGWLSRTIKVSECWRINAFELWC